MSTPVRVIDELEIYEISLVDNPANPDATFSLVKRDVAPPTPTAKAMPGGYEDKRQALQDALQDAVPSDSFDGPWVVDFTDTQVIFQAGCDTFTAPYSIANGVIAIGVPVPVRTVTTYEPVAPTSASLDLQSPATILAGAGTAPAPPTVSKESPAVSELAKTIEGLGLAPEQLQALQAAAARDELLAFAKGSPVSLIDQISTLVTDPQASAGLAALRDVLSSGSSSSSSSGSSSSDSSSSSNPFSASTPSATGTVSSGSGLSSGSSSSGSSGSSSSSGSTSSGSSSSGSSPSTSSGSDSTSGDASTSSSTPSATSRPSTSGSTPSSDSTNSATPFSKDAPPAGPAAPAGVANTNVGVGNNAGAGTGGPNPAGFAQEIANGIVAALRAEANQGAPAVADPPVFKGEKIVAQNVPVAGLAKAAEAPADPTKEAVKVALLGEDRTHALEKALAACNGDYSLFTKYQQELGREVVVEDARELFGGFASLHNIQVGR